MTAGTVAPDCAEQLDAAEAPVGAASASVAETAKPSNASTRRSGEEVVGWRMAGRTSVGVRAVEDSGSSLGAGDSLRRPQRPGWRRRLCRHRRIVKSGKEATRGQGVRRPAYRRCVEPPTPASTGWPKNVFTPSLTKELS